MLEVSNLRAGYKHNTVLQSLSFSVQEKQIVSIIGSNGAGKTTLLNTISGLVPVLSGTIAYRGNSLPAQPHRVVRAGIVQVPEGRKIFSELTVRENLVIGAFSRRDKSITNRKIDEMYELFPRLKDRASQVAATLSGGEQQMLAIARGLMAEPVLLLLDEPSLGLAPKIVESVFTIIEDIRQKGITILLVEQNANKALAVCDYGFVLENGAITCQGAGLTLANDDRVKSAYIGISSTEDE